MRGERRVEEGRRGEGEFTQRRKGAENIRDSSKVLPAKRSVQSDALHALRSTSGRATTGYDRGLKS
jgi:hypothetical protein